METYKRKQYFPNPKMGRLPYFEYQSETQELKQETGLKLKELIERPKNSKQMLERVRGVVIHRKMESYDQVSKIFQIAKKFVLTVRIWEFEEGYQPMFTKSDSWRERIEMSLAHGKVG